MKIYLLKTPEFAENEFQNIYNLLESFDGPIQFIKVNIEFDKEKFVFLQKYRPDFKFEYQSDKAKIEFDSNKATPLSWQELFSLTNYYRNTFDVLANDFVVLLTDRRNALNWFSCFDKSRNIFVHTKDWELFTNANPKYPIAYQIIENVMEFLMKLDAENLDFDYIHASPIGCMNDFCINKEQIIIKLQTANICDRCMEKIQAENIDAEIIDQVFSIFEGVRNELIFKKRFKNKNKTEALPLTITSQNKIFIEKLNVEIRLKPMEKTLYLFYLKQENGVCFKDMVDYKLVLSEMYSTLSTSDNIDTQTKRIASLVNPVDNSFNIQKARINKIIVDLLGDDMAMFYKIDGSAGNPFRINLDKSLIQFQQ